MNPSAAAVFAFNPDAQVRWEPITGSQRCLVIDDALRDPEALVQWTERQRFKAPRGYPYPGVVVNAPATVSQPVGEHFALRVRGQFGGRRTLNSRVRLSMITTPPQALDPWQ